jgi:HEPN domain-containing protein
MKTKEEHIRFWMEQSEDDWKAVFSLLFGKNYLQALFFTHLVIEKLCKALWIKYNTENVPPRSNNLVYLLAASPIKWINIFQSLPSRINGQMKYA